MTEVPARTDPAEIVAASLGAELARGDAMLSSIPPILRHLLVNDDHSVFGDEIIARVRGMLADLASQLRDDLRDARGDERGEADEDEPEAELVRLLADVRGLVTHLHALALETQLTDRLHGRLGLDPVLSPLMQALVSSSDRTTSGTAMNLLAAQSRFVQSQRRMQLALTELPGDLLHGALMAMRAQAGTEPDADAAAQAAEAAVRGRYDESRCRLGLIARMITGMGGGAVAALSVTHAGVALFLSALSIATGQDRDLAVLSTNEGQIGRLALTLRAAGLRTAEIEEQFLALHPEVTLPDDFDSLAADRAAAILAISGRCLGA